jgi:hypothetical protein
MPLQHPQISACFPISISSMTPWHNLWLHLRLHSDTSPLYAQHRACVCRSQLLSFAKNCLRYSKLILMAWNSATLLQFIGGVSPHLGPSKAALSRQDAAILHTRTGFWEKHYLLWAASVNCKSLLLYGKSLVKPLFNFVSTMLQGISFEKGCNVGLERNE